MGQPKKKITIIAISSLALVAVAVAVVLGVATRSSGRKDDSSQIKTTKAIQSVCEPTDYKQTCETVLKSNAGNENDPKELIKVGFRVAIDKVKEAMKNSSTLQEAAKDPSTKQALENCQHLMESAIHDLNDSISHMGNFDITKLGHYTEDLKVWLTGAGTFQENCVYEFENTTDTDAGKKIKDMLKTSRELTANGLNMVNNLHSLIKSFNFESVKMQHVSTESDNDGYPSWVDAGKRRLLQATPGTVQADVVVAQDGTGKYKSINEALKDYPAQNPLNKTFVVHIKAGVYKEYVTVTREMKNVMFIGDGATKTTITGNKNFIDGVKTMNTATVAILGANFIAKDIGFENSAGAIKHQAVALRVQADNSVFHQCQMDGYQDTLYVHAHRQFYRDCTISGTIDFVFGDAVAVFQNCKFVVRKPLDNQGCMVTAQGRTLRDAASGIVIQNSIITGDPEYLPVKDKNKAYLGRPWKEYSRTVYLQSEIDGIIAPEGWMAWDGNFGLDTCFYAEFGNRGPGADQSKRVTWKGIKKITAQEAAGFTIGKFLQNDFIKVAGVPHDLGMKA